MNRTAAWPGHWESATYLGRGITADVARAAGVRYVDRWPHLTDGHGGWQLDGTSRRRHSKSFNAGRQRSTIAPNDRNTSAAFIAAEWCSRSSTRPANWLASRVGRLTRIITARRLSLAGQAASFPLRGRGDTDLATSSPPL